VADDTTGTCLGQRPLAQALARPSTLSSSLWQLEAETSCLAADRSHERTRSKKQVCYCATPRTTQCRPPAISPNVVGHGPESGSGVGFRGDVTTHVGEEVVAYGYGSTETGSRTPACPSANEKPCLRSCYKRPMMSCDHR
jgi:hypothetical protein